MNIILFGVKTSIKIAKLFYSVVQVHRHLSRVQNRITLKDPII